MKQVQAIKDRWAACMRLVHKDKRRIGNDRYPTQMVYPKKFCSSLAGFASIELLTSDAVFETMQGRQPIMAVQAPSIITGG